MVCTKQEAYMGALYLHLYLRPISPLAAATITRHRCATDLPKVLKEIMVANFPIVTKMITRVSFFPARTWRCFNVVTTSKQHCINVKTTSCAYWVGYCILISLSDCDDVILCRILFFVFVRTAYTQTVRFPFNPITPFWGIHSQGRKGRVRILYNFCMGVLEIW